MSVKYSSSKKTTPKAVWRVNKSRKVNELHQKKQVELFQQLTFSNKADWKKVKRPSKAKSSEFLFVDLSPKAAYPSPSDSPKCVVQNGKVVLCSTNPSQMNKKFQSFLKNEEQCDDAKEALARILNKSNNENFSTPVRKPRKEIDISKVVLPSSTPSKNSALITPKRALPLDSFHYEQSSTTLNIGSPININLESINPGLATPISSSFEAASGKSELLNFSEDFFTSQINNISSDSFGMFPSFEQTITPALLTPPNSAIAPTANDQAFWEMGW